MPSMGTPARLHGVDDHPRAIDRGLQQRPVDIRRPGGQGGADEGPGQLGIHQHGAVAVPPVERDQTRLARPQPRRVSLELGVEGTQVTALAAGHGARPPAEQVADGRLTCLVAEQAGDDAVLDDATGARHDPLVRAQGEVTGAGAHDRHQLARAS